ncbi:MAG: polysaccharide deacetylase family protein [Clostridia bacterium]|nr:polysaccharide deacetylase family protein [Clostridia bacterium]
MADKYLIINADDFGMCGAANEAVMDLFKAGRLKSSTIMMPCKFAKEAVQFSIDNPQYAIGVHLTTTSEWGSYNWGPITDLPSLKNEKGFMWPECEDFAKHADLEEARQEILAQVKLAESMGMKPSHLDNHMGSLYGIEGGNFKLLPMTMKLCGELGYAFRMCRKPLKKECPEGTPYFLYAVACKICDHLGKKNNVIMPDYLIFPKWNDEMRTSYERYREMFLEDLVNIPAGFSETYVHPSVECDEIKGITARWRDRVWEYQIMKDPKTEQHLNAHGIELISYRDMIEMKK